MEVSIILINYNTRHLLANCIDSIVKYTEGITYEIIVIDNGSNDGSRTLLENDRRIKYIYSEENLGFGRANNLGASNAIGNFLFFLNSDTLLTGNAMAKMLKFMNEVSNSNVAACGMMLKDKEGIPMHSFGTFPTLVSECLPWIFKNKVGFDFGSSTKFVDYVTGADLFIRKDDFNLIGGFDKKFFMYYEETDLEKRLQDIGKKVALLNENDIIHLEGGSFENKQRKTPIRRLQMQLDSRFIYIKKHFGKTKYVIFRFCYAAIMLPISITFRCDLQEKIKYIRTMLS